MIKRLNIRESQCIPDVTVTVTVSMCVLQRNHMCLNGRKFRKAKVGRLFSKANGPPQILNFNRITVLGLLPAQMKAMHVMSGVEGGPS